MDNLPRGHAPDRAVSRQLTAVLPVGRFSFQWCRMNGWWKFHRAMYDHPVWRLPHSQIIVFLTILGKANHTSKEWFDGNMRVQLQPGELITSQSHLAESANTTRQVVRDTLTALIRLGTIGTKIRTKRYTQISVVNWNTYQGEEFDENQDENRKRTKREPSENHSGRRKEEVLIQELHLQQPSVPENGYSSWPQEWKPILDKIHTIPFLITYKHWLCDLEWWKTMDELFTSCPKRLDALLLEAAAYIKTEDYRPRSKKALRMKLRNCMDFSARRAERESQGRSH